MSVFTIDPKVIEKYNEIHRQTVAAQFLKIKNSRIGWESNVINHEKFKAFVNVNHNLIDIVFSGKIANTEKSVKFVLDDIFPFGFYRDEHYNKTHGAKPTPDKIIKYWGMSHKHMFAVTQNNDCFVTEFGVSQSYNTCCNLISFIKHYETNSDWSFTFRGIIDLITRLRDDDDIRYYMDEM